MREIFDRYNAMSVGELSSFPRIESEVMKFVSAGAKQLNMVFNYDLVNLGQKRGKRKGLAPFIIADFKHEMSRWQRFVNGTDAWTTIFIENHDHIRSISRFGSEFSLYERIRSGKMLAMLLATMTGTLFLYQGQEIGMVNAPRSWPPEEYKDIRYMNRYAQAVEHCAGDVECLKAAIEVIWGDARDHARLPMQWDSGANAGFTSEGVTPWMRINDDWKEVNVAKQTGDSKSLLEFWKTMLRLRKEYKDLFIYGRYTLLETEDPDLFAFTKEVGDMKSLTIVNMSPVKRKWEGPPLDFGLNHRLLLGNILHTESIQESFLLPWEGRVYLNSE